MVKKPPAKRTGTRASSDPSKVPEAPVISAQVVLTRAPGHRDTLPTAATIAQMMPPSEVIAAVTGWFRARAFEVGPVVGNSFSITAPPDRFEAAFHIRLLKDKDSRVDLNPEGRGLELPVERLPRDVARGVQAVVFTPPPDFGPSGEFR
jgi:hypothetical protein